MIVTETQKLETTTCAACGVLFAMPDHLLDTKRKSGEGFYCPNGHSLSFRDSENKRLQRELEEKQRQLTAQKCETLRQQQLLEAERVEKSKLERRVKHGTCPCCKRTFVRLASHISKKHPDFGPKQNRKLP